MSNFIYEGPFGKHIQDFVQLKKAIGYKYDTEARHLKRFDEFTIDKYPSADRLSKEIVLDWGKKRSYEAQANQCSRASIIRQFGKYMDSLGLDAYIIPKGYYPTEEQYIPHIYTPDELKRFFAETDKCHYCIECPDRHLIMPVFFRMIYSCGLRVSEARLLKVGDVDLDNGILIINHSKKDNSRLVPMSGTITKRCRDYARKVHPFTDKKAYFFPALGGRPMTIQNVYHNFRRFLWRAGISHGGRGKGPRIHDFRHTFACHCLKRWVEQGKELSAYLPILKAYMGHDSFEETAYYLRMTADVFPDITIRLEGKYPDLIPGLEGDADETD
ncbi:tyrosine-type recombinase/integrase [Desulforamulus ferrireducens]|uniref:Integrase n=1 Tax=Desulforamulus ferrireducens TaxID=1833852 RepID=A0A1S6IXX3_9FIRM|nr:tyrosine-type recombinase/integrase [Desulforamulus ferrireducens]AQS59611.1 integrase [Desulforamulus ferrireducens]